MTAILSVWAAILSTVLAAIKLWEMWSTRMRLRTSFSFTGDPQRGNEITIQNPTDTPVMINYWELLWRKRFRLKSTTVDGIFPEVGYCDITVGQHASHYFEFRDDKHFDWGRSTTSKGWLYLRLHVVGRRKPVTLMVYDPKK